MHRDFSIFTRACVCNVFLVAKIYYVLQVLHCTRANIQKIHRVFARFVWRSGSEPMRRDNLFRSVKSGGLGLTHLFIRQLITRFLFLRDQTHPFLRAVIQTHLGNHLPSFLVTSYDDYTIHPKGFLKEVTDAFRFLSVRFSHEYLASVTKKKLSSDLIAVLFPEPLYRSIYSTGPGQDVLCRVRKMCVPPSVKTFFFKLHSGTLPVKTWMHKRGIFVPWSVNCILCKSPESIDHVFIYCWDAVFFWDVLKRTLKKELYITEHSIRFLPIPKCESTPIDMIILLGLHSIWLSRMSVRHAEKGAQQVHIYFLESVRRIKDVLEMMEVPPDWLPVLDDILGARWF